MTIEYTVAAEHPSEHRALVTMRFETLEAPHIELVLPSWTPGSYRIDPYSRTILWLRASDPDARAEIAVERLESSRWRFATAGAKRVEVRYEIYGHGMVNEGIDLTPDHLFVNAPMALAYVEGRRAESVGLTLETPSAWTAVTELPEDPGHRGHFVGGSYDHLVDSPVDVGTPQMIDLVGTSAPHRIAICGRGGNFDAGRLATDVGKIVQAAIDLFGESPVARYTFFIHLNDVPDGGLEHRTSCSCVVKRLAFRPEKDYRKCLALLSHEYFHAFNGTRIKAARLDRPDLTREVHTGLLWLTEGTTDYYTYLLPVRAGVFSLPKYYEHLGRSWADYLAIPGRTQTTLEESSFLTWILQYHPYEHSPNQTVSYYLGGRLASLALDLEIRHRSGNARSLDDVMRLLWEEYGKPSKGIEEGEFPSIVERATGHDHGPVVRRLLSSREPLDVATYLRHAGLILAKPKPPSEEEADDKPETAYLGATTRTVHGYARLESVLDGGPARSAGLSPGDEIVAIGGHKVTSHELAPTLGRLAPGTTVTVAFFRRGLLTELPVVLGTSPPERWSVTPVETPTHLERTIFEQWLNAKWAPSSPSEKGGSASG